ncbi:hypothetical protein IX317_002275 [Fusobacterium sp. DD29]|uniref:FAD-I family protein n=1 Tax=unclassified Fusobacterium TaxID=2648384 RepID=UPI001B8CFFF2|nr:MULTISPECIES: FAD-I family protein [unclassified Fusobacterium]MBR8750551.1 hypothetical protein [Fusobacterium sp. DD29]MBR8815224.1 hypothetical protein [Fusobacterium sp. DD6]
MKKFLLFLSVLAIVGCTSANQNMSSEDAQKARLIKLAEEKEMAEQKAQEEKIAAEQAAAEQNAVVEENVKEAKEEAVAEEPENKDFVTVRYNNKTRGQIMQAEMARITDEMKALEQKVNNYLDYGNKLREYKEKLDNLEKLNNASIN